MNKTSKVLVGVTIVLTIILIAGFTTKVAAEGFYTNFSYGPACTPDWRGRVRIGCRGITTGIMPAIETSNYSGCGLCCGKFGVPP